MNRRLARGVALGLISGLAAAAATEVLRPRGGSAVLVDWDEVRRLLRRQLGDEEEIDAGRRQALVTRYRWLAGELEEPLLEVLGGLPEGARMPPFDVLSRGEWAELNVEILRRAIDPVLEAGRVPDSRLADLGRAGIDRYVASVLGFLSRRVLGQFDPQLLGKEPISSDEGLYLVEPNIAAWAEEADLPADDLRRWLILHESTHAWQFHAHPWLREHMNASLQELLRSAGAGRDPVSRLLGLTVGMPGQWAALRRMQAVMTLVEGYSNLVMNLVGRRLLPSFDLLEEAYRRRSRRGPLESLFWKLIGLDLKLQQYRRGEAFCQAVHDAHGMEVLNLAWESPESLPRPEEIGDPEAWYRRVAGKGGGARRAPAWRRA